MWRFFPFTKPLKTDMAMENLHSSNGWVYHGFPVVILDVVFFFIRFVEIILLRLSGSKPSSPERTYQLTGSSEIALTKVQDDIMRHLSRRMQERFEWFLNIFWHYFWKTHLVVTCTSVVETLKQCIFNWKTYILEFLTPRHNVLMIQRIIPQFV